MGYEFWKNKEKCEKNRNLCEMNEVHFILEIQAFKVLTVVSARMTCQNPDKVMGRAVERLSSEATSAFSFLSLS